MPDRKFICTIVLFLAAIAGLVGYGYRREQRLKADFQKAQEAAKIQCQNEIKAEQFLTYVCKQTAKLEVDYCIDRLRRR